MINRMFPAAETLVPSLAGLRSCGVSWTPKGTNLGCSSAVNAKHLHTACPFQPLAGRFQGRKRSDPSNSTSICPVDLNHFGSCRKDNKFADVGSKTFARRAQRRIVCVCDQRNHEKTWTLNAVQLCRRDNAGERIRHQKSQRDRKRFATATNFVIQGIMAAKGELDASNSAIQDGFRGPRSIGPTSSNLSRQPPLMYEKGVAGVSGGFRDGVSVHRLILANQARGGGSFRTAI